MLVVALLLVHVAPPRGGPDPLLFGVLPWDLAVHVVWMLLAALAVVWMTTRALWPDDPPHGGRER